MSSCPLRSKALQPNLLEEEEEEDFLQAHRWISVRRACNSQNTKAFDQKIKRFPFQSSLSIFTMLEIDY